MGQFLFTTIPSALILSIFFLKVTAEMDTLLPNQTISIGQILISRGQVFEMGFFSPGKSPNRFLGIWYKNTPDVVVWVANRNNPITDSHGVTFAISGSGSLVLSGAGSIIWSANSSGMASNPVLRLLDTGNLVLVDEMTEGYIWQSFDYPTDTWLPGMKIVNDMDAGVEKYLISWKNSDDPSPGDFVFRIENLGLPDMVIFRGKTKTYRTGKWIGLYFSGGPPFPDAVCKPEFVIKEERLISMWEPHDSLVISRLTLEASGVLERYTMNARKDKWNPVYSNPKDPCDVYGLCGPYGICRIEKTLRCECFKGFSPKFQKDWDLRDWSGGCTRNSPLNCQNGDGFLEIRGVKYPDMLKFWLDISMSLSECRSECFRNCNFTAYANPYITNGGSGCVMWFGDLNDTNELSAADTKQNIYIRLPVSELDSSTDLEKKEKRRPTMLILLSIASGVLVSSFINGGVFLVPIECL